MKLSRIFLLTLVFILRVTISYGACSSPVGDAGCTTPSASAGTLEYNSTLNVFQYCDGSSWVTID